MFGTKFVQIKFYLSEIDVIQDTQHIVAVTPATVLFYETNEWM